MLERQCNKETLTKEDYVTDIEKEVVKQLRGRNYRYAINKPGLGERICKKWNVYVPEKCQSILGRALLRALLTLLLEDPSLTLQQTSLAWF